MEENTLKINMRHVNNVKYLSIYLLTICSFIIPFYLCDTNRHNLKFCLPQIPLVVFLLYELKKKDTKRSRVLGVLVLCYFLIFGYYNFNYLHCTWAWIYKTLSFVFLWQVTGYQNNTYKNKKFIESIGESIVWIFTGVVIISLLFALIGGDSIFLDLQDFHIRRRGIGLIFSDSRLTWVFMHKSSYGLLLALMFCLVMKKKHIKHRKFILATYFVTAILVNSMVSIASIVIIIIAFYLDTKQISRKVMIRIGIAFFFGLLVSVLGYFYISFNRDLSSLGDRAYIWAIYGSNLSRYPNGMGKRFFSDTFWISTSGTTGRSINNFHNVFLNEIIHYSVPVGVIFTILIIYIPIKSIKNNKSKLKNIIITTGLMLPIIFDQAINCLLYTSTTVICIVLCAGAGIHRLKH